VLCNVVALKPVEVKNQAQQERSEGDFREFFLKIQAV